jgi:Conserved TM helix
MHQQVLASINFSGGVSDAWSSIARFVPKLVGFLVILLIGWFISRLIARALDAVLRRIGFEKVAERGGVSRMLANSKYDTTGLIAKIVYYTLLLITLQLALGVFGTNPVSTMIDGVVAWLPRGLVALAIVIVAAAIARVVKDLVGSALSSLSYGGALGSIAAVFVMALGVIAALGQAGIATTITGPVLVAALATIAGVIIVGVGGGMIQPMRQRWERMLDTAESEMRNASSSIGAYQRGHSDAISGQPTTPQAQSGGGMPGGGMAGPEPGMSGR